MYQDFDEIRIENTNHCGYKCFFCPREKQTRPKGYMLIEDLQIVIDKVGNFSGQVDLHGFGEPLLDLHLPNKIELIKRSWPSVRTRIYSTLGLSLKSDYMLSLVESGLDVLEVSLYGVDPISYKLAHGVDKFEQVKNNLAEIIGIRDSINREMRIIVREFPKSSSVSQPGVGDGDAQLFIDWLKDLGVDYLKSRELHNYGDGRSYNIAPKSGVCSVTWGYRKRILQITWDLNVIPCCFDFNASVVFGNIRNKSLEEIYSGRFYREFITAHEENNLNNYKVCLNCDRCFQP